MRQELEHSVSAALRDRIGRKVAFRATARGGGLHATWILDAADGSRWFLKTAANAPPDQFPSEAAGLDALAAARALRIPRHPIAGGPPPFLLMEAIDTSRRAPDFPEALGRGLARLHLGTPSERYGFPADNYLGSTPQANGWLDDWETFVRERRLQPQLERAREAGLCDPELDRLADGVVGRLGELLAGPAEPACLIHGDLWSGNVLADEGGAPVLVDPACWYGRREAELGMMLLFGGFPSRCYDAYDDAWPLSEGWRRRAQVFVVYHLLNHLNLFGRSYRDACVESLRRLS